MAQATTGQGAVQAVPAYNIGVVKKFVVAAMFWGVVGFFVGDFIAWQLAYPLLNFDLEWTTFGRPPACSYVSRYFCFWRQHSHREFPVYCSADVHG